MDFFLSGRQANNNFNWSSLEGAEVIVNHGSQPMTMFKYACHRAGIDISKINIIDAGNAREMDIAFRTGKADYIHQQGQLHSNLKQMGSGMCLHWANGWALCLFQPCCYANLDRVRRGKVFLPGLRPNPKICMFNASSRNSISPKNHYSLKLRRLF